MPAKNTSKKASPADAAPVEPAATASPESSSPDSPSSESSETTVTSDSSDEAPLNRAERRARGKGKIAPQPTTHGKVVGQHGPAHTHRMWSNRRSG